MHKKELVGDIFNNLRLTRQRYFTSQSSGGGSNGADAEQALQRVNDTLAQLLMVMEKLDNVIGIDQCTRADCRISHFVGLIADRIIALSALDEKRHTVSLLQG